MKYTLISIVCFALLLLSKCSSHFNNVIIEPLPTLTWIDTVIYHGNLNFNRSEYFLVKGFNDNKETADYINLFASRFADSVGKKYNNFTIMFLKESSQTNAKNIIANPRVIDRYSQENDWIYKYSWAQGKLYSKWKVRNGEIIEPNQKDIEVKDLPLK